MYERRDGHRIIGKVHHTTPSESLGKGVVGCQHAKSLQLGNVRAPRGGCGDGLKGSACRVVLAESYSHRREVARREDVRVDRRVDVPERAEHAEDLLAQRLLRRIVHDRRRVALDLVDAQEDRLHNTDCEKLSDGYARDLHSRAAWESMQRH